MCVRVTENLPDLSVGPAFLVIGPVSIGLGGTEPVSQRAVRSQEITVRIPVSWKK